MGDSVTNTKKVSARTLQNDVQVQMLLDLYCPPNGSVGYIYCNSHMHVARGPNRTHLRSFGLLDSRTRFGPCPAVAGADLVGASG